MKKFHTDTAANLLCNMRIRIEGIVQLYEDDAAPLQRLTETNDMLTTAAAFDVIGSALYDLRQDIRNLHTAHVKECARQAQA